MVRKIIEIDERRCNGCGACVSACHEGAIGLVGGKAQLLRDDYCDGLEIVCLPALPGQFHLWSGKPRNMTNRRYCRISRKKQCKQFTAAVPVAGHAGLPRFWKRRQRERVPFPPNWDSGLARSNWFPFRRIISREPNYCWQQIVQPLPMGISTESG